MHVRVPATVFRDALKPVAAVVNEAVIHTNRNGIVAHGMTADKTGTVTVTLPAETFTAYSSTGQTLGLTLQRPVTFLDYLSTSDTLTITGPGDDRITFESDMGTYRAGVIDPSTIFQNPLNEQTKCWTASVTLPSTARTLKHSLTAADLCSETITVHVEPTDSIVRFTATGDTDNMASSLTRSEVLATDGTTTQATYPVSKLRSMYDALYRQTDTLQFSIDDSSILRLTGNHTDTGITTHYTLAEHVDTNKIATA